MTRANQPFTDARFKSDGDIAILMGSSIVFLLLGILADSGLLGEKHVFGKFLQVFAVFVLLGQLVTFARHRVFAQPGKFSGACPYCGTPNDLEVLYPTEISGKDCSNCKNRFLLKDSKFYRLPPPSRLPRSFSGIKDGIGLIHRGIIVACFSPVAFLAGLAGLILGTSASLLWIVAPILLFVISLAMQVTGVWLCLQTPDRISARSWIITTVWLQGITIALLIGKLFIQDALWLDLLVRGTGLMGQFAFLTFLVRLCNFLQRGDLGSEFDRLITSGLVIVIGMLSEPLVPSGYKILLLVFLTLGGFGDLVGYLGSLKRLETHLGKALTAYN